MKLQNILNINEKIQFFADESDSAMDSLTQELSLAEDDLLLKPVKKTLDAVERLEMGLYLCENDRCESETMAIVFRPIREFLLSKMKS